MIAFAPLAQLKNGPLAKICGLRSAEHAHAAAEAGAALLGLVFAPSRRRVTPDVAASIVTSIRCAGHKPGFVGVFVNEQPQVINQLARHCNLDAVQLSGDEPPDIFQTIDYPVIVAIRLLDNHRERGWIDLAQRYPTRALLLIDAHVSGSYGGAGVLSDWSRAARLAQEMPILLAGGLTPDNVVQAITTVHPFGVDVSSGVETNGIKDIHKIQAFLHATREKTWPIQNSDHLSANRSHKEAL